MKINLWIILIAGFWLIFLTSGIFFLSQTKAEKASIGYFQKDQARQGKTVFAQHCANCHGPRLRGISAPALIGTGFWTSWKDKKVQQLSNYIRTKMPQGQEGTLPDEFYFASTAYILEQNGLPAGEIKLGGNNSQVSNLILEPSQVTKTAHMQMQQPTNEANPFYFFGYSSRSGTNPDLLSYDGYSTSQPLFLTVANTSSKSGKEATLAQESPSKTASLHIQTEQQGIDFELEGPNNYQLTIEGSSLTVTQLEPGTYKLSAEKEGFTSQQTTLELEADRTARFDLKLKKSETPEPVRSQSSSENLALSETSSSNENSSKANGETGQSDSQQLALGHYLYEQNCTGCHGAEGNGGIGPSLHNNSRLDEANWVVKRILLGAGPMPAFGARFDAHEVASLTQFLSTWNRQLEAISEAEIREIASQLRPEALNPALSDLSSASLGQQRYTQVCSACHGLQGGGDVGPPLAGNPNLDNTQLVLSTILFGRGVMPAFSLYPDEDIAAIASYIRSSWSNAYGQVIAPEVNQYRPDTVEQNPDTVEQNSE
ncbi:MAG: c-type cytochrome [Trueperaceae bacterium]|nr:c-type cytochrome [Trueperaceae bacterium]